MQAARDQLNRRSRFSRSPRSPRMKLSDRDVRVLLALTRYRYLPSSYLCRLVGGNATTLKWRLRELFDAGLVLRPANQWQLVDTLSAPVIYELSRSGFERLRDLGLVADGQRASTSASSHFWHALLVSELMASFEIAIRETEGLELIAEAEIVSRLATSDVGHLNPRAFPVGDHYIIPDGLFGVRSPAGVTLYALEADRGQEPLTRTKSGSAYRDKFDLYRRLIGGGIYKRLLLTPAPLLVLHISGSSARQRTLIRLANDEHFHLFQSLTTPPTHAHLREPEITLLTTPWDCGNGSVQVIGCR